MDAGGLTEYYNGEQETRDSDKRSPTINYSPAISSRYLITSPSSPFSVNVPSATSSVYNSAAFLRHTLHISAASDLLFAAHRHSISVSLLPSAASAATSAATSALPLLHTFRLPISSPVSALLPTLSFIITSHLDHRLRVWSLPPPPLSSSSAALYRLRATLPSTLQTLLASLSGARSYVPTERRRSRRLWLQHADTISDMAAEDDESLLYTASWDRSVKIWGLKKMVCLQSIERAHDDAVSSVAVAAGGLLLTASADGLVKGWKKVGEFNRVLLWKLAAHGGGVPAMAIAAGGDVLYTAGATDCAIRVWEQPPQQQHGIRRRNDGINSGAVYVGNRKVAKGGGDRAAAGGDGSKYWRMAAELRGHRRAVLCLAVAGPLLCSGSADRSIRVWMRSSTKADYVCMAVLEGHDAAVRRLCISPTLASRRRCLVCSASIDGAARLWSVFFSASHSLRHHLLSDR